MRVFRATLLVYLTVLLAWFLPSHTRGQITMPGVKSDSCCAPSSEDKTHVPTQDQKANCAVCFWAAGILPEVAVIFDVRPIDLALIIARQAIDQCALWFIPTEALPRGPPALLV